MPVFPIHGEMASTGKSYKDTLLNTKMICNKMLKEI